MLSDSDEDNLNNYIYLELDDSDELLKTECVCFISHLFQIFQDLTKLENVGRRHRESRLDSVCSGNLF
jgi:hypothetical protein